MAIPDSVVDEVRARADLVELAGEYTRLKRSGRTFRGPCPLHGGEGPNFSVDPAKGFFHCFVCGEGGDVFAFPMKLLGLGFLDAVRMVAERAGVEIPEQTEDRPRVDPHAREHEANAFAASWFRRQLWEEEGGADARAYLERRGVSREAADRFGLGWAPASWSALGEAARSHGIADELLLDLGLVKPAKQGGRTPYDAFRGRLIFPIEDLAGRTIGFGGRVLGDAPPNTPKYLNSPESAVYHKGSTLYGLGWSRHAIRRADQTALVVEGYMDFVSLAAHGVENAVAPLGTAMTPEQAALLARYAERVVLLYDSDPAGQKATFRTGDELLKVGVEVRVATLPDGEDPDSVVRGRGGAGALRRYLADAVDVLERKLQILEQRDGFRDVTHTRRAIDRLLPTVRAASDEVLRGVYLKRISDRTGVAVPTLEQELADTPPPDPRPASTPERRQPQGGRRVADTRQRRSGIPDSMGPERTLLLLLLRDESYVAPAAEQVGPDDFRDLAYREIFRAVLAAENGADRSAALIDATPDVFQATLETLREEAAHPEAVAAAAATFDDTIARLRARPLEERITEIDRLMHLPGAEAQYAALSREQQEMRTALRELGVHDSLAFGMLRPRGPAEP